MESNYEIDMKIDEEMNKLIFLLLKANIYVKENCTSKDKKAWLETLEDWQNDDILYVITK